MVQLFCITISKLLGILQVSLNLLGLRSQWATPLGWKGCIRRMAIIVQKSGHAAQPTAPPCDVTKKISPEATVESPRYSTALLTELYYPLLGGGGWGTLVTAVAFAQLHLFA